MQTVLVAGAADGGGRGEEVAHAGVREVEEGGRREGAEEGVPRVELGHPGEGVGEEEGWGAARGEDGVGFWGGGGEDWTGG